MTHTPVGSMQKPPKCTNEVGHINRTLAMIHMTIPVMRQARLRPTVPPSASAAIVIAGTPIATLNAEEGKEGTEPAFGNTPQSNPGDPGHRDRTGCRQPVHRPRSHSTSMPHRGSGADGQFPRSITRHLTARLAQWAKQPTTTCPRTPDTWALRGRWLSCPRRPERRRSHDRAGPCRRRRVGRSSRRARCVEPS